MHSVAGILHRDIKPGNILINPAGEEGNRGILIDYDHAIRTADTSPYSTKRKIVSDPSGSDGFPLIQTSSTTGNVYFYVAQRAQGHRTSNVPGRPGVFLLCHPLYFPNTHGEQAFTTTLAAST